MAPKNQAKYSKGEVNRAGIKLMNQDSEEYGEAKTVLDHWRACHVIPLNSFQRSLRKKLVKIDDQVLVSQRLKRAPSIISKLKRNERMSLSRMQDIGGIRAVVKDMKTVRDVVDIYKKGTRAFSIVDSKKDYIIYPKKDGYRSVHLIFKCKNGFAIELQIRTQLQHAWATAVETMGTFLNIALKSGEGPQEYLDFFSLASSAFAVLESTPRIPGYDALSDLETFEKLIESEKKLNILSKLSGFRVVAKHIKDDNEKGQYHLITLDLDRKRANIQSYEAKNIKLANIEYSKKEEEVRAGKNLQVVLVSSESINALKKSYPSYFLDAEVFSKRIMRISKNLEKSK